MGYTHYWTLKKVPGVKMEELEARYIKALKEIGRVVRRWNKEHPKNGEFDHFRLAGYTARTARYGGINFNGKQEYAHEDFVLREHFNQGLEFDFCKTAHKPYDTVVVAALSILKYRLGDAIEVSSDGEIVDWLPGVLFARRIINRQIPNPMGEIKWAPVIPLFAG